MSDVSININRRELLGIAASAGAASLLNTKPVLSQEHDEKKYVIVDTNISLFHWSFRRLPLDETKLLVKKLHSLGILQAWAGSFEGILHRDIARVNQRLADECKQHQELIPIGSINPNLPDWKEDLNRCAKKHNMPGIRLHPNYHGYKLDDPHFVQLLKLASSTGLFVQIAVAMEDSRTQHPKVRVADVDLNPLPDLMQKVKGAKVQILNYRPRSPMLKKLAKTPGIYFDTARVEGTDGVPKLVQQVPHSRVMFGSHAPFLIPEAALVRVHESSKLESAALESVLSKNSGQIISRNEGHKRSATNIKSSRLGLPTTELLKSYRIWDSYFTPSHSHPGRDGSSNLISEIERALPAIKKGKFEKLCYFAHVGIGTTNDNELEKKLRSHPQLILKPLERWQKMLIGMIQLNANNVNASLDALNCWLRDGPMLGVYFPGGGPGALTCTHRNFNKLVERIAELNGVIMQHTWFKTGGKKGAGESTPTELAELATRFPQQKFICAHAGGEWQKGIRAVRKTNNVLVETSGFDATAGVIEMAVRELGAERVIFGSHLPSRSLGTELCKITTANISEKEKRLILGKNFRNLLQPIMKH